MADFRVKLLLLFACGGVVLGIISVSTRRPDLTDPAKIAKLPPKELRDAEIECLVRAAFREARSVHIKSEAAPSITVVDSAILGALADRFAVGSDDEQLPLYRYPGLEYTDITFDGPYTPRLGFMGKDMLMSGESGEIGAVASFRVRTTFARGVADLLRLKLDSETSKPRRTSTRGANSPLPSPPAR